MTKQLLTENNVLISDQLPPPNTYRSIFRKPDGTYDWETELDYGWGLIDRASCGSLAACIVQTTTSGSKQSADFDGRSSAYKAPRGCMFCHPGTSKHYKTIVRGVVCC